MRESRLGVSLGTESRDSPEICGTKYSLIQRRNVSKACAPVHAALVRVVMLRFEAALVPSLGGKTFVARRMLVKLGQDWAFVSGASDSIDLDNHQ